MAENEEIEELKKTVAYLYRVVEAQQYKIQTISNIISDFVHDEHSRVSRLLGCNTHE